MTVAKPTPQKILSPSTSFLIDMIEGDDLVKIGNGELSDKAHQTCTESVKLNLEFVI